MESEMIFKIILICIYCLFTIIRINFGRLSRKNLKESKIRETKFRLTSLQIYIAISVIIFFLYIFLTKYFDWGIIPNYPVALRWVGVGFSVLSLSLFLIVHIFLGQNFSYTLKISDNHSLITNGPYRFVRHPMYSAFLILHVSIFLITQNWFIGIYWILGLIFILLLRIPKEEEMLKQVFDQRYQNYIDRTGSLFPPLFKLLKNDYRSKIINQIWQFEAITLYISESPNYQDIINWLKSLLENYRLPSESKFIVTKVNEEKEIIIELNGKPSNIIYYYTIDNINEDTLDRFIISSNGFKPNHGISFTYENSTDKVNNQLSINAKGTKEFIKDVRTTYEKTLIDNQNYQVIFFGP